MVCWGKSLHVSNTVQMEYGKWGICHLCCIIFMPMIWTTSSDKRGYKVLCWRYLGKFTKLCRWYGVSCSQHYRVSDVSCGSACQHQHVVHNVMLICMTLPTMNETVRVLVCPTQSQCLCTTGVRLDKDELRNISLLQTFEMIRMSKSIQEAKLGKYPSLTVIQYMDAHISLIHTSIAAGNETSVTVIMTHSNDLLMFTDTLARKFTYGLMNRVTTSSNCIIATIVNSDVNLHSFKVVKYVSGTG